jgi:hypothetical protein
MQHRGLPDFTQTLEQGRLVGQRLIREQLSDVRAITWCRKHCSVEQHRTPSKQPAHEVAEPASALEQRSGIERGRSRLGMA